MRRIVAALLLITACGDSDILSPDRCDHPCYDGPSATADVGTCRVGLTTCDADGHVTLCAGQVLPLQEQCNGLDDDCDGRIDNEAAGEGDACGHAAGYKSSCTPGNMVCRDGVLSCVGGVGPAPEICNDWDDDCDGFVDNVDLTVPCYDGDLRETLAGDCRAGVRRCERGVESCAGQVLPSSEVCNGRDDDCDGIVDDLTTVRAVDIVIYRDRSSSMSDEVGFIERGLVDFLLAHSSDVYRYAVIDLPGIADGFYMQASNFVDADAALGILDPYLLLRGSAEPSWDALYDVATGLLPLRYRDGSLLLDLLFTDEEGQSYEGYTQTEVADALRTAGHTTYIFQSGGPLFADWFTEIVAATNGGVFTELDDGARLNQLVILTTGDCK